MIFERIRYIIMADMSNGRKIKLPPAAIVALSFLILILSGTLLLCIPPATRDGHVDFITSLFTATSATCVTGLIVEDTFTYWSYYGQAVILLLIQIGGLGFITIMSLFIVAVKRHSSLSQRKLAMQSAGSVDLATVRPLLKYIIIGTAAFEFAGAVLLCFSFVPVYGWGLGIWEAIFTSISAFCNAGFTITGANGGDSLCAFVSDPLVNVVVMLLVIVGGIGFFVWGDVIHHGIHLKKYSFHSKVVFATTGALIVLGWAMFMAFEWNNPDTIGNEDVGTKILACLFMSVTPRTAGFNTVNYAGISSAGNALTTCLMFIGGSPGSTAGGIKTTTATVFVLSMIASSRRYDEIHLYERRFENDASSQASAIVCLYILVSAVCIFLICAVEGSAFALDEISFEVVSAIGTVGLSRGITRDLHAFSQIVLALLMFFGRVGGFTFVLIFSGEKKPVSISRVAEKIIIG